MSSTISGYFTAVAVEVAETTVVVVVIDLNGKAMVEEYEGGSAGTCVCEGGMITLLPTIQRENGFQ